MAWFILFIAGLLEIGWAVGIKYTNGFSKLWPSVITIAFMVVSMGMLAQAVRTLPVGTAYAVWTGIGVVGTVIYGIVMFGEALTPLRILFVMMIITGIAGLKFVSEA